MKVTVKTPAQPATTTERIVGSNEIAAALGYTPKEFNVRLAQIGLSVILDHAERSAADEVFQRNVNKPESSRAMWDGTITMEQLLDAAAHHVPPKE